MASLNEFIIFQIKQIKMFILFFHFLILKYHILLTIIIIFYAVILFKI